MRTPEEAEVEASYEIADDDESRLWSEEDDEDAEDAEDVRMLDDDDEEDRMMFADPGGRSALRAATKGNPRNLPCPNCGAKDRLTRADKLLGYQCDRCADALERGGF